jgi:hypothetical protein
MVCCTIDHYRGTINIKISPTMPKFIDLSTNMEVKSDLGTQGYDVLKITMFLQFSLWQNVQNLR